MTARLALACWLLGGCTAIYGGERTFKGADAGSADLASTDQAVPQAGFGASCGMASCQRQLTCETTIGGISFPNGGICAVQCGGGGGACSSFTNASCAEIANNMFVCLPGCDLSRGMMCGSGYTCCNNGMTVNNGPGVCAPPNAHECTGRG